MQSFTRKLSAMRGSSKAKACSVHNLHSTRLDCSHGLLCMHNHSVCRASHASSLPCEEAAKRKHAVCTICVVSGCLIAPRYCAVSGLHGRAALMAGAACARSGVPVAQHIGLRSATHADDRTRTQVRMQKTKKMPSLHSLMAPPAADSVVTVVNLRGMSRAPSRRPSQTA